MDRIRIEHIRTKPVTPKFLFTVGKNESRADFRFQSEMLIESTYQA